jgi:hypothetical protein
MVVIVNQGLQHGRNLGGDDDDDDAGKTFGGNSL